jgi:hypothetical protein
MPLKRFNWRIIFGISLSLLSALLYFLHYTIFRDARHIFIYLLGDIAFIPVQVLLVTLIIDQLLKVREKRIMLKKMNMVIGVFFSEVGVALLKHFFNFDHNLDKLRRHLILTDDWSGRQFLNAKKQIKDFDYGVESKRGELELLRSFLIQERMFLLGLLENPNLLEHESFTELLWAVFHVTEELAYRVDVKRLTDPDYAHLSGDIKRAYVLLITEWLAYMQHLKGEYPYLFSLAVRINPFNPHASPEIE